jgi:hypothetical protein
VREVSEHRLTSPHQLWVTLVTQTDVHKCE